MNIKIHEMEYCGKQLRVEISDLADQANGSVLVRYGETAVFATAVISKNEREGIDFFPLMVDYEERFYAAGRILGSRFIKREGRPSEEAVLTGRIIDRAIRPLFDKKTRNETQVIVLALSVDGKNDSDIPAIIAASLALGLSDIPWDGPIGAARIGYANGKFLFNPSFEERETSLMDLTVCGKDGKINMMEAGAKEISEEIIVNGLEEAIKEITKVEAFQQKIIKEDGKKKVKTDRREQPAEMAELFAKNILPKLESLIYPENQGGKKPDISGLQKEWKELVKTTLGEEAVVFADESFEERADHLVHNKIVNALNGQEKRPDGRNLDEIRKLRASIGLLPSIHGSAVFYRGETHILSAVTLGGPQDAQLIEGIETQTTKHFMHHYNFPPFSTGETGRMGSPGRREIGHGALVERALLPVIPPKSEFPYTIRVVSESMASNGSTSQGSICASTMALMDAGVPIKNPVAGISMGLMMKNDEEYKILTDIQGFEDHFGDMDFKCAGTKDGVTAIQMDVKIGGIPLVVLKESFEQAKKARAEIMETMLKVIAEPKKELSPTAPRIIKMMINPDKIREVIGPGGKMINSIIDKTGAEIDIEQDGSVYIVAKNNKDGEAAKKIIEGITHEYVVDELVSGKVSRLFDFGAMVEIGPMQEGLAHISELALFRVNKVTDVVNIGDEVKAKIISIDEKGRINLSVKRLDPNYKQEEAARNRFGDNGHSNGKPNSNHRRRF